MFGAYHTDVDFNRSDNMVWVEFKELFQLYQRRDLDISILQLWHSSYRCRSTYTKVAFLDPGIVNFDKQLMIEAKIEDCLFNSLLKLKSGRSLRRYAMDASTFRIFEHEWILRQKAGTNLCGFYIMRYMLYFIEAGNDHSNAEKLGLDTSELLPRVIKSLINELCGFIRNHVVDLDGAYNLNKHPPRIQSSEPPTLPITSKKKPSKKRKTN
ncbi:hypothetical protein E2562_016976 [Oryza meyeriana var. granulata]|uniref:Ubiquitin-like protease family profile domain-containing protein n=1 Tax=Oryza meyeriana var. granulata TaxID=110450 RepID=A0A6G1DZR2_9ORYZ|nr:hypothetical protein E2562_016976 [Oryza meyeriana var. granulata]